MVRSNVLAHLLCTQIHRPTIPIFLHKLPAKKVGRSTSIDRLFLLGYIYVLPYLHGRVANLGFSYYTGNLVFGGQTPVFTVTTQAECGLSAGLFF